MFCNRFAVTSLAMTAALGFGVLTGCDDGSGGTADSGAQQDTLGYPEGPIDQNNARPGGDGADGLGQTGQTGQTGQGGDTQGQAGQAGQAGAAGGAGATPGTTEVNPTQGGGATGTPGAAGNTDQGGM